MPVRRALTVMVLVPALLLAVSTALAPVATALAPSARAPRATPRADAQSLGRPAPGSPPAPETMATHGIVPPANPPANIPPSPNFLQTCSGATPDSSPACVDAAVQAFDNAREQEGLPGLVLPSDWAQLTPTEQLFVITNLERTVRGLPPMAAMASALDQAAAQGAASSADPTPPSSFPWSQWGSNWAGALGNPLEAVYLWMYDDGPGSSNIDCPSSGGGGCWGHRDNVLLALSCQDCVMGTGFDPHGWDGYPSWTEILVETSGSPATDFTWAQVASFLPGAPAGSAMAAPAVGMAPAPGGGGYWLVASDGGVFSFGDARFFGSMGGKPLSAAVVGMAPTPDGGGYWLVASDGGIFTFGDAPFRGSAGGAHLAAPVVSLAPLASTGYWLAAADGGVFSYGVPFHGSMA